MKIEVIGQDAEAVKAVAAKVNAKGFEAKACPSEDLRRVYELNDSELADLSELARECGYCSIRDCLNSLNWWDMAVDTVRAELNSQLEEAK